MCSKKVTWTTSFSASGEKALAERHLWTFPTERVLEVITTEETVSPTPHVTSEMEEGQSVTCLLFLLQWTHEPNLWHKWILIFTHPLSIPVSSHNLRNSSAKGQNIWCSSHLTDTEVSGKIVISRESHPIGSLTGDRCSAGKTLFYFLLDWEYLFRGMLILAVVS